MRRNIIGSAFLALGLAALLSGCSDSGGANVPDWTAKDRALIGSLSLSTLPRLRPDPSNRVSDDPAAARFGQALFFDKRLSGNGQVACATCHDPDRQFQDGLPLAKGIGTTARRAMPIAGTAYSPFMFWDGRRDSQWAQALGPLESAVEHGTDRTAVAHQVVANYAENYRSLFGPLPDLSAVPASASPLGSAESRQAWAEMTAEQQDQVNTVFANIGKAIAAFERLQMPKRGRFDAYADAIAQGNAAAANAAFSASEQRGLALFIGKASCVNCHNGPLLTDQGFHNIGVPAAAGLPQDIGRAKGVVDVQADPFNCLGAYSDAQPEQCTELMFIVAKGDDLTGAFKTPSLRGASLRAPYMHAGQFATLADVVAHYNAAPASPVGHTELKPLHLSADELAALEAFLRAIDEPVIRTRGD
ncbi:MAG TPA: cytochrome c peroxidase [Devosiaceae bacterium]